MDKNHIASHEGLMESLAKVYEVSRIGSELDDELDALRQAGDDFQNTAIFGKPKTKRGSKEARRDEIRRRERGENEENKREQDEAEKDETNEGVVREAKGLSKELDDELEDHETQGNDTMNTMIHGKKKKGKKDERQRKERQRKDEDVTVDEGEELLEFLDKHYIKLAKKVRAHLIKNGAKITNWNVNKIGAEKVTFNYARIDSEDVNLALEKVFADFEVDRTGGAIHQVQIELGKGKFISGNNHRRENKVRIEVGQGTDFDADDDDPHKGIGF